MKNNISSQKCRFVKNFYKPHRMYHKHKKTIFHLKNVFVAQFYWPNKAYLTKFLSKIWAKKRKNISLGNDCQKSKMEESKTGPEYNFTISGVLNSYLELVWQRYPIFFIFPIFHIFKFLPKYEEQIFKKWEKIQITCWGCLRKSSLVPHKSSCKNDFIL